MRTHINIHLYGHLIPTSQCLGNVTDTSCNFPHKPTVCNNGTGFMYHTVTFLKHFKFGRAPAKASPAPAVGEGHLIFHNYHMYTHMKKQTQCQFIVHAHVCVCVCVCVCMCVQLGGTYTNEHVKRRLHVRVSWLYVQPISGCLSHECKTEYETA